MGMKIREIYWFTYTNWERIPNRYQPVFTLTAKNSNGYAGDDR